MPSVKQIEAFYWSATLGSFVAAADRLNTTQSNISKRIQEMELTLKVEVFDRSRRAIRLTAKGEELLRASENFMRSHNAVKRVGGASPSATGPFRFGVTEAVALTWLPKFCAVIAAEFPGLIPMARVAISSELNTMLRDRRVDLVVATRLRVDADLEVADLGSLNHVWLASPMLGLDGQLSAERLAEVPILGHGDNAAADLIIIKHLRERGLSPNFVTHCNNLTTLARMAAAGMGITYLHRGVFNDEIRRGLLKEIRTEIDLPPLRYVAVHRDDPVSPLTGRIARIAQEVCDFSLDGRLLPAAS